MDTSPCQGVQFETFWQIIDCEHSAPRALCQVLYIHDPLSSSVHEGALLSPRGRQGTRGPGRSGGSSQGYTLAGGDVFLMSKAGSSQLGPFDAGARDPGTTDVPWDMAGRLRPASRSPSAAVPRGSSVGHRQGHHLWPGASCPRSSLTGGLFWSLGRSFLSKA